MTDARAKDTTFGVFVRFRKSRLPLRRGISRLEDALAVAATLRRDRLHGQDDVFVVREPDGIVVDDETASEATADIRSGPPQRDGSEHENRPRDEGRTPV